MEAGLTLGHALMISAATAGAGAYMTSEQAKDANWAARRAAAAEGRRRELVDMDRRKQAEAARSKVQTESAKLRARIRTAVGESGAWYADPLLAQVAQEETRNLLAIQGNLGMGFRAGDIRSEGVLAQIGASQQDPLAAAFGGAIQGFQLGLNIVNSVNATSEALDESMPTATPLPVINQPASDLPSFSPSGGPTWVSPSFSPSFSSDLSGTLPALNISSPIQ
jgi:hypothetical protein